VPRNPLRNHTRTPSTLIHQARSAFASLHGAPSTAFRLARGSLDCKPRPRKISDSHDPGSSRSTPILSVTYPLTKAFDATTSTYVATVP
jgi:hypothetical protein